MNRGISVLYFHISASPLLRFGKCEKKRQEIHPKRVNRGASRKMLETIPKVTANPSGVSLAARRNPPQNSPQIAQN